MTIMIGAPISRNRAWILPRYLAGIYNLNYPKEDIHLAFLVNGYRLDDTSCIIEKFKEDFGEEYAKIDIWHLDNNEVNDRNTGRDYEYFANIRNLFVGMRRHEDTHIFSIDSDIILDDQNTLNKLLEDNKPIVSTLIYNGTVKGLEEHYNILIKDDRPNTSTYQLYRHIPVNSPPGLREVDTTGACYLIEVDVFENDVYYSYHPQGEDCFWCLRAQQQGFPIYCDERIQPRHLMNIEEEKEFCRR